MFKSLQVLRTNRSVKTVNGTDLPSNTRVVVIRMNDNTILARVADPKFDKIKGDRVTLAPSRVKLTFRGRPRKVKA